VAENFRLAGVFKKLVFLKIKALINFENFRFTGSEMTDINQLQKKTKQHRSSGHESDNYCPSILNMENGWINTDQG